jgi:hypothetical protein
MPLQQWSIKTTGNLLCQLGFPGTRLTLDEDWPTEGNGGIDGRGQIFSGNVAVSA